MTRALAYILSTRVGSWLAWRVIGHWTRRRVERNG